MKWGVNLLAVRKTKIVYNLAFLGATGLTFVYTISKGSDQIAHPHSLIIALAVDNTIIDHQVSSDTN